MAGVDIKPLFYLLLHQFNQMLLWLDFKYEVLSKMYEFWSFFLCVEPKHIRQYYCPMSGEEITTIISVLIPGDVISPSDQANYHWLMKVLEKSSDRLCDQDKFKILVSQTELNLAC